MGTEASRAERGEIAFVGRGGRRPRVLAHGPYGERWLVQSDRYLYWTDSKTGEITRLPKGGGVPMVLATALHPTHLLRVDDLLYWVQSDPLGDRDYDDSTGGVARMPIDGGTPEVVLSGLDNPEQLTVSGRDLAVSCAGAFDYRRMAESRGSVVRATLDERKARTVATKQRWPQSILFVDDELYWLNHGQKRPHYFADGALLRMKREGEKKRWVVHKDQSMANSLVVDDEFLHWTTAATVYTTRLPGVIYKRPRGGGPSRRLVTWREEGGRLTLDATHLYWLSHDRGRMYRVRKEGGEPELMMTCDENIMISDNLVVDDHCVYWTVQTSDTAGGAVWSMAKEATGGGRGEQEDDGERAN